MYPKEEESCDSGNEGAGLTRVQIQWCAGGLAKVQVQICVTHKSDAAFILEQGMPLAIASAQSSGDGHSWLIEN